ncbi:hypothetical protein BS17DRAFT_782462 [Gyrodon lividus]|nr:hypothetical protein BS17DRAFT_782462 [Gyrodon lividus]
MDIDIHGDASTSSNLMDHSSESISHTENTNSQRQRQSQVEPIRNALTILRESKISLLDFLSKVMDPSEK